MVGQATAGEIPTLKVNYLLVKNIEVSGLQVSDYRKRMPERMRECFDEVYRPRSRRHRRTEADHFGNCPDCGANIDMRDLAQVLAHVHDPEIEIGEGPQPPPRERPLR
jgi:hypothetical protein